MRLLTTLLCFIVCYSCSRMEPAEETIVVNPYYDKAYAFYEAQTLDSAFLYFSKSKEIYVEAHDSLNTANCLVVMSVIQQKKGDFFGAQESALEATRYLDDANPDHYDYIAPNYNVLGVSTYKLEEFDRAIDFYKSAIKYSTDSVNTRIYKNNIGLVYHDKKEYGRALEFYLDILNRENSDSSSYARTLTNYANTMSKIKPDYRSSTDLLKALGIRQRLGENEGLNSSYASLTEYYKTVNPDSAFYFAKKQYEVTQLIDVPDDKIRALYRMSMLTPNNDSKSYFERYVHLSDSLRTARAAAKNQFALIRYEVEKNKADNLRLQKDNAEHASRLVRQRAATGGIGIVLLVVVIGGRFYYKKRKQRLELEAQNKIKASQLETSRKVHDVVANGIYRVMTTIEHRKDIDRGNILDQLEDMYSKSRDISYEAEGTALQAKPYTDQISDLLKSFANESHKVLIVGNEAARWQAIRAEVKEEVLHILQELMVNMKKHSQADRVVIRFEEDDQALHLSYVDNGIGMEKDKAHGNGLTNTGNRIANLGGKIIFASEPGKGLRIDLFFPILK